MGYIFIAHVEEDADIALCIALGCEEAGYHTWCYEIDSIVGTSYIVRTGEAVAQSDAVIVIISPHSLSSTQVTKEVVRAHESGKHFLPILRGISHIAFQQRQPEWREAIGSATSIRVPKEGGQNLVALIIEGIKSLQIKPSVKVDAARVSRIRQEINELSEHPVSQEGETTAKLKLPEEIRKPRSKKPLLVIISSLLVVAIAVTVTLLSLGKDNSKQVESFSDNASQTAESSSAPVSSAESTKSVEALYSDNASQTAESSSAPTSSAKSTKSPDEHYQCGVTLINEGQYEQAVIELDMAIEIDPNSADAYLNRGIAYFYLGKYDTAITDLTKAIELDPNNATAYNYRAGCYSYKRKYDIALNDYYKAIELSPNYWAAYHDMAITHYDLGEYDTAIADLTYAIAIDPTIPDAYSFRGYIYMIKKQYDKAIEDFSRNLVLEPDNEYTYLNRGICYKALGNKDAAIADFNKCIEIATNPSTIQQAQVELIGLQ